MTHNVPQRVINAQSLVAVRLTMGSRKVLAPNASGIDATSSGDPLCSSLNHLLLEPFHLKKKEHTGYFFSAVDKHFYLIYSQQGTLLNPNEFW